MGLHGKRDRRPDDGGSKHQITRHKNPEDSHLQLFVNLENGYKRGTGWTELGTRDMEMLYYRTINVNGGCTCALYGGLRAWQVYWRSHGYQRRLFF